MVTGSVKEKLENLKNELYEMRFNLKSGLASEKKLPVSAVDFPRINECYTGRKQRFVYGTVLDSITKVKAIIKFDLHAEPEQGKSKLEVGGNIQGIYMIWGLEDMVRKQYLFPVSQELIRKRMMDT